MASRSQSRQGSATPAENTITRRLNDIEPSTPNNMAVPSPGSMTQNLRALSRATIQDANKTPEQDRPQQPPSSRPRSASRKTPIKKITTPHAKLGFQRRATPARNREKRRSGRFATQGEDIFDVLRQLSRQTADKSAPFVKTPAHTQTPAAISHRRARLGDIHLRRDSLQETDDDDDEPLPKAPRLSGLGMKIISAGFDDEDDEEEEMERPRQQSAPYDEQDRSEVSIIVEREQARRAESEQPYGGYFARRPSIGGYMSDRFGDFDDGLSFSPARVDESIRYGEESFVQDDVDMAGLDLGEGTRNLRNAFGGGEESFMQDSPGFMNGNDEQTDFRIPETPTAAMRNQGEGDPMDWEDELEPEPEAAAEIEDAEAIEREAHDDRQATALKAAAIKVSAKLRKAKDRRISKHGIEYDPWPVRVTKKLVSTFWQGKVSKDVLEEIHKQAEKMFANMGDDAGAIAQHRQPKSSKPTIQESDMLELMKRQRLLNPKQTLFSHAVRILPSEMLHEIKIQVPNKNVAKPKKKKTRLSAVAEEGEEEAE